MTKKDARKRACEIAALVIESKWEWAESSEWERQMPDKDKRKIEQEVQNIVDRLWKRAGK